MAQFGSSRGITAQSVSGIISDNGQTIINPSTEFGNQPLGVAAVSQALFGIANPTFDNLPQDPFATIQDSTNPLPYWSVANSSSEAIDINMSYDDLTKTYSVLIDPSGAVNGDYLTLTTRSFITTDDNLSLRQKALAVLEKVGTYASTNQWSLSLSAEIYDHNDALLSQNTIGTVYDNTTWTSIGGFTTSGTAAVGASAAYVDLIFRLDVTATVNSGVSIKIKSLLLASKVGALGGSLVLTDTITSSTTWTVPTGVTSLLAVVGVGAGGGGAGGSLAGIRQVGQTRCGGGGGGGGAPYLLLRDVALGTATSITIGIGAGGAGGTAVSATKPASNSTSYAIPGGAGAAGGDTTFGSLGSFFTITGGGGGSAAGTPSTNQLAVAGGAGGAAGSYTSSYFTATAGTPFTTATGGRGGSATTVQTFSEAGVAGGYGSLTLTYPYLSGKAGVAGGSASVAGTAVTSFIGAVGTAAAGTAATFSGGGGGASSVGGSATTAVSAGGNSGGTAATFQGAGGAAGGGLLVRITGGTGSLTINGGGGGSASAYSGGGGGAGGAVCVTADSSSVQYDSRPFTVTTGVGGKGADAAIVIVYVS